MNKMAKRCDYGENKELIVEDIRAYIDRHRDEMPYAFAGKDAISVGGTPDMRALAG